MSRQVKNLVVDELQKRYGGVDSALVVRVIGLDAVTNNGLRRRLHGKKIELHVVKNSLARVALKGKPLEPLANALDGPVAVVTGGDSIIDVAKELVTLLKDKQYGKLELQFGVIEGDRELIPVERIAKMKGRREMHADIAGCAVSPGRKLAGCIAGPAGRIAGCLKAIVEKGEKAGSEPATEAVAPAA
jgi:large subunit ribosomal protein L10